MTSSIVGSFVETALRRAKDAAARYREGERWVTRTWSEMDADRRVLASGLIALGLQRNERVNILANTSYKWVIADLAIQSTGGETVPIYQSSLAHECEYIIDDCEGVVVFAENKEQVDKLRQVRSKLARVRKVVVMSDETDGTDWTVGLSDVEKLGREGLLEHGKEIDERTRAVKAEDVLTLIYTSGTTGMPKGVVLTHANLLYEVEAAKRISLVHEDDVQLLFLPMAHSFAKVLECIWLGSGHEMAIDSDLTRITANMALVKPTIMCAVPRIFEKVYAKVVGGGLEAKGIKGKLFKWALRLNDEYAQRMVEGRGIPVALELQLSLAKKLVFSKIHAKLSETFGGHIRLFVSGGAPLPKKMAYFFNNAGFTILEGYGLTETSAATCVNRPERNKVGTVGPAMPGTEIKIAPDGEILIRGPGVMREYWKKADATREAISPDGWFSTGDIGVVDLDGFLKITDRKKDIIVTAGGKNIAPQNIEGLIKSTSSLVSQVMVHGDRRKFLSALITIDAESARKLAADKKIPGGYLEICRSSVVEGEMRAVVDRVNRELASHETIKKFKILERDFEVGEELTPTLKVKRKYCNEKFRNILDGFYQEAVE